MEEHTHRGAQRGVTLIEMMVAIGLSLIVIVMMTGSMFNQQEAYYRQLDYVEAQQNARASVAILRRYIRDAGFGFESSIDAEGAMPVGTCFSCADISNTDLSTVAAACPNNTAFQVACDNVDPDLNGETVSDDPNAGVDRLRVIRMDEEGFVPKNPDAVPLAGPALVADASIAYTYPPHPFATTFFAVISGECNGGSAGGTPPLVAHEILEMGADAGAAGASRYSYALNTAPGVCDTAGWNADFKFGPVQMADFFIHWGSDGHPKLMLRLGADKDLDQAFVVAHDIEDLQVVYGVDTGVTSPLSTVPDGKVNEDEGTATDDWCDDLEDGTCATSLGGTAEQLRARVKAVRVSIVTRTRDPVGGSSATGDVDVENHVVSGITDGYRRWVYRATVALRNSE